MPCDYGHHQHRPLRFAVRILEVSAAGPRWRQVNDLTLERAWRVVERAARRGFKKHLPAPANSSKKHRPRMALVASCLRAAAEARRAGNLGPAAHWVEHARRWRTAYESEVREFRMHEAANPSAYPPIRPFPTYERAKWGARGGDFPRAYVTAAIVLEG